MSELSAIESIFHAALAKAPPDERAAFLAEACGGDADLRRKVEELLQAQENAGPFLEQPAAATIPYVPVEGPGTRLGPYKLLQQIGEGGMGIVYMAEQEQPVRRRVALKVIKPGMDSAQVIARFQAERQALAMMDHQNIARVFDAGTTDAGRPYFVMELVHGVPITKYCDDAKLTPRQRLDLFVPVCRAIQHAHQKGILHRDIKPSNVLVCLYDGQPVPKVIDFGVAKAMEQSLTERTMFTQFGQVIGTLEYMSPEQAEMSQLGVDTRSDVYSLGVLLYELLTGSTPLERKRLREAGMAEILRMIREEEPPPPSTRLSTSKESLVSIAQHRHTEPAQLTRIVRGELDWIVMKSIEKDRTRRYDSAGSLAGDLERFLKDEPVEACPPSATYRLRKYARKHRPLIVTTAAFMLLLIAGTAISVWQAVRATNAEQTALEAEGMARESEKAALNAKSAALRDRESLRRALYNSEMNLAASIWENDNAVQLTNLLDRHRPSPGDTDLRGFEWFYWQRRCRSENRRTQLEGMQGNTDFVSSPYLSPSGRLCVAADWDFFQTGARLRVWDTSSGRLRCDVRLTVPLGSVVENVQVSPDDSLLVITSSHHKSKSDDFFLNRLLRPAPPPPVLNEDQEFLAKQSESDAADWNIENRVIEVSSGRVLHLVPEKTVTFHFDGKRLLCGRSENSVKTELRWRDAYTGEALKAVSIPFAGWYDDWYSIHTDSRGSKIAMLDLVRDKKDGLAWQIRVFDAETGAPGVKIIVPKDVDVSHDNLMWSRDGQRIYCKGAPFPTKTRFTCWDAINGNLVWKHPRTGEIHSPCSMLSADGRRLLLAEHSFELEKDVVTLLDAISGQCLATFPIEFSPGYGTFGSELKRVLRISPDGQLVAWQSSSTEFSVLNALKNEPLCLAKIPTRGILQLGFNSSGDEWFTIDNVGMIRVWDARRWSRQTVESSAPAKTQPSWAELSPDARWIAQLQVLDDPMDNKIKNTRLDLIDAHTGQKFRSFGPFSGEIGSPRFAAGSKRIAVPQSTSSTTELILLDIESGKHHSILKQSTKYPKDTDTYCNVQISGDGHRCAFTVISASTRPGSERAKDHRVSLFDLRSEKELPPFALDERLEPMGEGVTFDTSGSRIASMTWRRGVSSPSGHGIIVKDVETGRVILQLEDIGLSWHWIELSPDGHRLLLVRGSDEKLNEIQVRDVDTGKVVFHLTNLGARIKGFSPDGRRLFGIKRAKDGISDRSTLRIWDAEDGRELGTIVTEYAPYPMHFTPDGQKLVALRGRQRFPGDAVLVVDATPFPEDLPRPTTEKK